MASLSVVLSFVFNVDQDLGVSLKLSKAQVTLIVHRLYGGVCLSKFYNAIFPPASSDTVDRTTSGWHPSCIPSQKRNFDSSKKLKQVDHLKIGPQTLIIENFALPSFVQLIFSVNVKRYLREQMEAIGGGCLQSSWQRSLSHTWPYQTFVQTKMPQQLTLKKLPYWPYTLPANAPRELHLNIYKMHRFIFLRNTDLRFFTHPGVNRFTHPPTPPHLQSSAHPLITDRVLRECALVICPSITHLFKNLSITAGACYLTPGNIQRYRSRRSSKIGALPVTPQTTAWFASSCPAKGKYLTASKVLVYCNNWPAPR